MLLLILFLTENKAEPDTDDPSSGAVSRMGDQKMLHIIHIVNREWAFSRGMVTGVNFILELVNMRGDILPGYQLRTHVSLVAPVCILHVITVCLFVCLNHINVPV